MRFSIAICLAAVAACLPLAPPAAAQVFDGSEEYYDTTRGWDVLAYWDRNGAFTNCGAVKYENDVGVMIGQGAQGDWGIAVPTSQTGTFGGGILDIDRISIDAQFEFVGGFAFRPLDATELQLIKAGSQLGIAINGDGAQRWWSLSGSTAAVLKVQECVLNGGIPAAAPQTGGGQHSAPQGSALLYPVPVGETQVGDCEMGFTGVYRCTFEGLPPKAGYLRSTRVADLFNDAPTLDLDALSDSEADVWALMGGNWHFMGRWLADHSQGDCLIPAASQTAEANANLGQDAWMICLMQ